MNRLLIVDGSNLLFQMFFGIAVENKNDFNGLGLFDGILICHFNDERKELYDKLKNEEKYKVFALSNDDSLVISSDNTGLCAAERY